MKTEVQIKENLEKTQKQRLTTYKRFLEFDNYEDMHALDILDAEIEVLEWVLNV